MKKTIVIALICAGIFNTSVQGMSKKILQGFMFKLLKTQNRNYSSERFPVGCKLCPKKLFKEEDSRSRLEPGELPRCDMSDSWETINTIVNWSEHCSCYVPKVLIGANPDHCDFKLQQKQLELKEMEIVARALQKPYWSQNTICNSYQYNKEIDGLLYNKLLEWLKKK